MASPAEFARRMKSLSIQIEGNLDQGLRKVVLAIDNALVSTTPVDTGTARSNWLASINGPASGTTTSTTPSTPRTLAALASFDIDTDLSLHLTNNLPYIRRLDEGSSSQQPAGFVRRAVLNGLAAVKSVKLLKGFK